MARSSSFAAGFDEPAFRSAIAETMKMGLPEAPAERLWFCWKRRRTFSPDDPAGNPYDWSAPAVLDEPGNPDLPDPGPGQDQRLQVNYALEFSARPAGSSNTTMGEIDTSRAIVTLLDRDYEQVHTADYAIIGDSRYRIQFDAPAQGLFGVTVWTVYMEAEEEA